MKIHSFDSDLWVPLPIDSVFPFFSDAHNLERITPPFLKFNVINAEHIVLINATRARTCIHELISAARTACLQIVPHVI